MTEFNLPQLPPGWNWDCSFNLEGGNFIFWAVKNNTRTRKQYIYTGDLIKVEYFEESLQEIFDAIVKNAEKLDEVDRRIADQQRRVDVLKSLVRRLGTM